MRIVSLDLSLTRTGYAYSNGGFARAGVLVPPKKVIGLERLDWIRREVRALVERTDLVVIEGYAFAQVHQAHHMGELGGVIRLALYDLGVPFVEIGPGVLKKFATGKGNAKKEDMLAAAIRRLEYEGSDHNEADALFLLHAALVHVGRCPVSFPQAQLAALDGITWPVLERKAVA